MTEHTVIVTKADGWAFKINGDIKPQLQSEIYSTISNSGHNPETFGEKVGIGSVVATVTISNTDYTVQWNAEVLNKVYWKS